MLEVSFAGSRAPVRRLKGNLVHHAALWALDLVELHKPRNYPAVSILMPMQRHLPGNAEDPIRLRDLVDDAVGRVCDELGEQAGREFAQRLHDAVGEVEWGDPAEGVAVFVAPGESRVIELPFPVPALVSIDTRFATREIVRGVTSHPRYRVLTLGEKPTRLFEGQGSMLTECGAAGFPRSVEGARGEPLASGGFPVHTSRTEEQHRSFFRDVDRALGEATDHDQLPLLLAGTERDLAYFAEVSAHAAWVIGSIEGNYEDASTDDVARLALPHVDSYVASQRDATIADLVEAVGMGRASVGIKPTWSVAREGRVGVLLVEGDFVYPAREVDGSLEPAGDATGPGVIDDAVDELIGMVSERGGEIVIVKSGQLAEHGPVAALLRY